MSLALTHFAVGALCATLLLAYLPVRTEYDAPLVVASGVWALLPDFWRVTPIYSGAFRDLGHSALGNACWLHSVFDRADPHESTRLAAVMLGVYFLATVIYAERRRSDPDIDYNL
ncbi:hypothetical protein [Natrinema versiforme]|uniref:Membrane-bound metal-dependent hydrolase n=1 Tax=Natrinema versiforme JCM 10478 TaxID=1227496 RepID=L9XS51_9EURY|nr:hypothetical protein [Natrinema versiforme]ELY63458.1 hypothetical protein C489_18621 [Natrinema versiforme JCM 10478]